MSRDPTKTSATTKLPREFELKLIIDRPTFEHLRRLDRLAGWSIEAPHLTQLRSIYFDTTDHGLRAAGLVLRVRAHGNAFVQTIKSETKLAHGVSTPVELEASVDGLEPQLDRITDKKIRRKIRDVVDGAALVAVFETDISRTSRRLKKKNVVLELALDDGTVRSGQHHRTILEAELELKCGARGNMISAAKALFSDHPFEFSNSTKAERGYELILGRAERGPQSMTSEMPTFDEGASCRAVLSMLAQAAAKQITANREVVVATDDPEGAHQMRVGLRRLRTALRAFSPLLNDSEKDLVSQAQSLARIVGELRDADVLLTEICAPLIGSTTHSTGLHDLRAALSAHRTAKRDAVRDALGSAAWRTLQLELALWPQTLAENRLLDRNVANWAPKALDHAWKKAANRAKHIEALDMFERHALRKALKNLRYCVEDFGQLYPNNEVKPFIEQLRLLQDAFGYLNDAATAAQVIAIARIRAKPDGLGLEAAGYVLGWHTARAEAYWKDTQAEWEKLKEQDRFWR